MASVIKAGNATDGIAISSDNTGILEFKTGTGSGTTALTLGTGQQAAYALGTAAAPSITFSGDTNTGIFSPTADTIAFTEGGAEVARFDSSGNFGIGTSSPNTKLHLAAAGDVGGKAVNSATTGSATFNVTNNSGSIGQLMVYGSAQGAYGALGSGEVALYCTTSTTLMVDNVSGVLKFAAGGNTERMRIDSSGNVGIGTNSPSYTLDVNGITYFRPTNVITSPVQNTWYTIVASAPGYSIWQIVVRSVKSANEQFTVYHLHFVVGGLSSAVQVSNYTVGAGCGNALQVSSDNIQVRVTTTGVSSISTTVTRLT